MTIEDPRTGEQIPASELPLRLRSAHSDRAGRQLSYSPSPEMPPPALAAVLEGAGYRAVVPADGSEHLLELEYVETLCDTTAVGLRFLVVGLNPSPSAVEQQLGFAGVSNRFWKAAVASGLVSVERDAVAALRDDGVGMTDLVKRPTRSARELSAAEYRMGVERLAHLVRWCEPRLVIIVGLSGWRAAVDRKTRVGLQSQLLGNRPVFVMPNPSGINAHETLESLTGHIRHAISSTA